MLTTNTTIDLRMRLISVLSVLTCHIVGLAVVRIMWAAFSEKVPSSMRKMADSHHPVHV